MSSIQDTLFHAQQQLNATSASPSLDGRILMAYALQKEISFIFANPEATLNQKQLDHFSHLVEERLKGKPIAKITGEKEFWKLTFKTSEATLDPRPDSETLIESALKYMPHVKHPPQEAPHPPLRLLDLGTGTGCLLLSLLAEHSNTEGIGVDANAKALAIANENAQNLGLSNRVKFKHGSWTDPLSKEAPFDLVISNPPYLKTDEITDCSPEVRLFDPLSALDGGPDGLTCYRNIAKSVKAVMKKKGRLILEIGKGQDYPVQSIFSRYDFTLLESVKDLGQITRCLVFEMSS